MDTITAVQQQEKIQRFFFAAICFVFLFAFLASPAFAQGGLNNVNSFLTDIGTWLKYLARAVATIALIWCGYRFLFQSARFMDLVPIIGGAVLIAGAGEIAEMLFK